MPCLAALAGIAVAGCHASPFTRIVRTAPLPVAVGSGGQLTSGPNALTLADIARQGPNTPAGVALAELFDIEWGYEPGAAALSDPGVLRAFGAPFMESAAGQSRSTVALAQPFPTNVTTYGTGTEVTVILRTPSSAPQTEYFLLTRTGGRWALTYSTVLLASVGMTAEEAYLKVGNLPVAAKIRIRAELRYRNLAARLLGVGSLPGPNSG